MEANKVSAIALVSIAFSLIMQNWTMTRGQRVIIDNAYEIKSNDIRIVNPIRIANPSAIKSDCVCH